jgi:hypothetical protein
MTEVSGFPPSPHGLPTSLFELRRDKSARQAVVPAAASLQTGFPLRSNRFEYSVFFAFLTPDPPPAEHLKPCDVVLGNRGPARRVGCPKDQFDILQCSITPKELAPIPSPDVGDGQIGKGEIAHYICFQAMVYKEAKN